MTPQPFAMRRNPRITVALVGLLLVVLLLWQRLDTDAAPKVEAVATSQRVSIDTAQGEARGTGNQAVESKEVTDIFAVRTWEPPPPPPAKPLPPPPPQAPPLPFRLLGRIDDQEKGKVFLLAYRDLVLPVAVGKDIDETYRLEKYEGGQLHFLYRPLNQMQTMFVGIRP